MQSRGTKLRLSILKVHQQTNGYPIHWIYIQMWYIYILYIQCILYTLYMHAYIYIHMYIYIICILYIYTMEYYSDIKKNDIMPFAATWVDLEIIILSEVSQKEKDMLSVICRI